MHPGVHFYLLNRHETTEFETGAAADAERDGVALPDLDLCTEDTCGYAQVKERSSEHNALELSACTRFEIQCAGSLRVRGLHSLLAALGTAVSKATHINLPACPTPPFSMTHAPTGRRSGHACRSDVI